MNEIQLAEVPFSQAAELWLESHKRYIRPYTLRNYRAAVRLLTENLGDITVKDIHIGHSSAD